MSENNDLKIDFEKMLEELENDLQVVEEFKKLISQEIQTNEDLENDHETLKTLVEADEVSGKEKIKEYFENLLQLLS